MVIYTQSSPRTISPQQAKLWNPSKTLGIINPDYDCLTCIGYAPSCRRRCRNPIRADNRALIMRTLDEIGYLPPDSPTVMSRLRAVAGPALCVRYHQGQAEAVVMQWQRKIQLLNPQIKERKPAKPVQSSRLQESARDREVQDLRNQLKEMMEAAAKLQEEINSRRHKSQECEEPEERARKDRREEEEEEVKRRRSEERYREARRKEEERLEKERLEKERLEKERLEKEKREKEKKQQRAREEAAATNERIRQRAQKIREEREREKQEKQKKEREERDQIWADYQKRWAQFKASASDINGGNIRDAIPWPVESGSYRDVKSSSVKEFFQKAASSDENLGKLMRRECFKWHPDKLRILVRGAQLSDVDELRVGMICRVVTELLNSSTGRSSDFLD